MSENSQLRESEREIREKSGLDNAHVHQGE